MSQNSPPSSSPLAKEGKVSILGFSINLIQFTKCLSIFGIIIGLLMFVINIGFWWRLGLLKSLEGSLIDYYGNSPGDDFYNANDAHRFNVYSYQIVQMCVPGLFFLIFSGILIFLSVFLMMKCSRQDITGIENTAKIAIYVFGSLEILVYIGAFVSSCVILNGVHSPNETSLIFITCMISFTEFFFLLATCSMKIHAIRTEDNSLLGIYLLARCVSIGLMAMVPVWKTIMILNTGLTIIVHAIRREKSNNDQN